MRTVYILRSLPGAGKSYLAKQLIEKYSGVILSTDDYWIRPDNIYDFNYKLIGAAHDWNKNRFLNELEKKTHVIIIDNTNTTWKEIKFYALHAVRNEYIVHVCEPETTWRYDVEECFKRNTHNVPKESIQKMLDRFESTQDIENKILELRTQIGQTL